MTLPLAEDKFKRQLLALRARSENLNPVDAENLLLDLVTIVDIGKSAALERATGKAQARDQRIAFAREVQGNPSGERGTTSTRLKKRMASLGTWLSSTRDGWDDVLDIIINKRGVDQEVADKFLKAMSITVQKQNFKARIMKWQKQFQELGFEAYGLDNWEQLHAKFF